MTQEYRDPMGEHEPKVASEESPASEEYDHFLALTKKVLSVPKKDLDEARERSGSDD